jgi:serine/threonine protein kinase
MSETDTIPPELLNLPDYQIKKELGQGGMGLVYLAHNTLMGRDEVLKVMDRRIIERPGALDRFLREIRAVAKLRHPNIVTAYSAFRLGESIVFAMEYIEGLDLACMVKAKGPVPVAHACNVAYQAALGLQHAHEEGLVHRDIKPANLMLSRKGDRPVIKILDFGLAKAAREEKVDGGLTREGHALGSPDYIAPEQIRDAPSADIRADIYSLGATLYYLLTGHAPFRAKSLYDLYQAHISRDAEPLNLVRPDVPAELAALVAKMMAKEPSQRFQTPGEVARALTPFFKKPRADVESPQADISRPDRATDAETRSVPPTKAADSMPPKAPWDGGLDFTEESVAMEPEPEPEAEPAVAPGTQPPWLWPSLAVGVMMLGLFAAWVGGAFKAGTPTGMIILENVPVDSDILVDGNQEALPRRGGGEPLEIRAVPGQHRIEVKKAGFGTFATEVTVTAGGSEELSVRLEPLIADRPGERVAEIPEAITEPTEAIEPQATVPIVRASPDSKKVPPTEASPVPKAELTGSVPAPASRSALDRSMPNRKPAWANVDAVVLNKAILERLEQPIAMKYPEPTPLEVVLKDITKATKGPDDLGIPIYVDPYGLYVARKSLASQVTVDLDAVPLKKSLSLALAQIGVSYTVYDGLLVISVPQVLAAQFKKAPVIAFDKSPRTDATVTRLAEPLPMRFAEATSLEDALDYIKEATRGPDGPGISIYVDPVGLNSVQRTMTSPITLDLEGVPLRTTLWLLVKQLGLGYYIKDGLLTITAEKLLHQKMVR